MAYRSDHVTSGVEVLGDLEEILQMQDGKTSLEQLKYLEGKEKRKMQEFVQNWLREQKNRLDRLPELLKRLADEVDLKALESNIKAMLEQYESDLKKEIKEGLATLHSLLEGENGTIGHELVRAVLELEKKRKDTFREMESSLPFLKNFLIGSSQSRLLEKRYLTAEMASGEPQ